MFGAILTARTVQQAAVESNDAFGPAVEGSDRLPLQEASMTERTRSAAGKGSTSDDSENSRFDRARDYVSDKASAASDAVKGQYNRVREQVEDADFGAMLDQVRGYVRSNPGKALLISVGVGFLVGLLLRRDEEDED
jgi:ElaB/YqjD/DUF883 family membrane-anchored ribosome-binding protein